MGLEFLIDSHNHPGPNSPRSHLQEEEEEEKFCDSPLRIFSWVVGGINFLRGLFLFVTFCCKKQVWDLVTRSCRRQKRPTMTMTGRNIEDSCNKSTDAQAQSTIVQSLDQDGTAEGRESSPEVNP